MGRLGSFFRKSDDKRSDQANDNPYAQQSPTDTYSPQAPSTSSFQSYNNNQYSQNQTGLPSGPRPGGYGRNDPNSAPPPYNQSASPNLSYSPYSPSDKKPSPSVGYGNDRFGAQSGYGANRFDSDAASVQNNALPPQRQGGYAGLGGNQLFDDYTPSSSRNAAPGPQQQHYGGLDDQYGQYGEGREMTEEERQDAEVRMAKEEIVGTLRDTQASTTRSRQMLAEGKQRMIEMNRHLARDADLLNRAEDRLDESQHQNKLASAHLDNLDAANTSILNFTANSRGKLAERAARKHVSEREREVARQELREEQHRNARPLDEHTRPRAPITLGARAKADNSRFTFEDDDGEQEEMNNNINNDIEAMIQDAEDLKLMAKDQGNEISRQNEQAARMAAKADKTQDQLWKNRKHIDTKYIKK